MAGRFLGSKTLGEEFAKGIQRNLGEWVVDFLRPDLDVMVHVNDGGERYVCMYICVCVCVFVIMVHVNDGGERYVCMYVCMYEIMVYMYDAGERYVCMYEYMYVC